MNKLKVAFFIFSVFLFNSSWAQEVKDAEIKAILQSNKADTSKVEALLSLAKSNFGINPNKSIDCANQSKAISQKINYPKGLARSYKNLGIAAFNLGNYLDALQNYKLALDIFISIKDSAGIANIYSNLGNVYYNQDEYYKALDLYIKSLSIAEKLGDKKRIATANGNIGAVYMKKRSTYYKALEYNKATLKIGEEIQDKNITGTALVNIGEIYLGQGNTDESLEFFQRSLKSFEGTENYPYSLILIGRVYFKKRDFKTAINYFEQAYTYSSKINDTYDMVLSLIEKGKTYEKTKEYKKALVEYKKAEKQAQQLGSSTERLLDIYQGMASSYGSISDYNNAYSYQKFLTNIKDTLYNIATDKKLNNLQFNFDLEKKQGQINLLQKEKELSAKEIRSKKLIQAAMTAFLIVLFVLLIFVYRIYIIKKKTNIELEDKNQKIENQKSEITKSIEYAQKIQNAMLPEEELIEEVLYNSFLFYKPKDIVSGDFYICIKEGDIVFIAVADCTGHGVPGALMSMIGSNILNKLITDKGLTDPAEILTQVNSELIVSLKQNKNAGNDGMDIALCAIDFKNKELKFAGAYRPIYLVRESNLIEIKGSKFPIGGHQVHEERQFITNTLELKIGDKYYLSTDGFADQFGGNQGKKLTTKKFKEQILSIKDKHIKQQGLMFQSFFEKWKGENEQLDDICILGFEVIET